MQKRVTIMITLNIAPGAGRFHGAAMVAVLTGILFSTGCVPMKKFNAAQQALSSARYDSARLDAKVKELQANIAQLNQQSANQKQTIDSLLQQLADAKARIGDLSNDAASKQSLLSKSRQDYLNQQKKLEQLQALMDKQKRAIEEIKKKMSDALVGFKSNELSVAIKNGKVYVSLQENLLFPSGSAVVNPKGKEALGKLAQVLNLNPDITVDIVGHTDSIPIRAKYQDNWDLSLARSASIVRILTLDYRVDPTRVIASGHSQYDPVQPNGSPEGRALNRRTDIILSPRLDELYKLLQTPDM